MIVTRTPMRISFVGGGTDMPSFYRYHTGAVISTAINKYVYIIVNRKFDGRIRVSYSRTENVKEVEEIQHDIVREAMKLCELKGLEIVSVSDVPGHGTGLGSSSAFAVGLINALLGHMGLTVPPHKLAEMAFEVEANYCKYPVGKQDHYAAAFGGLHYYEFTNSGVKVEGFRLFDEELAAIGDSMMLFWTGAARSAYDILTEQSRTISHGQKAEEYAILMSQVAQELSREMSEGNYRHLGRSVKASWHLKKQFSESISRIWIDQEIDKLLLCGAEGAKVCGAGGGGFVLAIADPVMHVGIESVTAMRRIPIKIGAKGSSTIYREAQ